MIILDFTKIWMALTVESYLGADQAWTDMKGHRKRRLRGLLSAAHRRCLPRMFGLILHISLVCDSELATTDSGTDIRASQTGKKSDHGLLLEHLEVVPTEGLAEISWSSSSMRHCKHDQSSA